MTFHRHFQCSFLMKEKNCWIALKNTSLVSRKCLKPFVCVLTEKANCKIAFRYYFKIRRNNQHPRHDFNIAGILWNSEVTVNHRVSTPTECTILPSALQTIVRKLNFSFQTQNQQNTFDFFNVYYIQPGLFI